MQKKYFTNKKRGFTIIETMISVGIFLIIVTIGMEALLNASFVHSKSESQRSVMDSLSFIMEDMSRNIRTGDHYQCSFDNGATFSICNSNNPIKSISFNHMDNGILNLWKYKISNDGGTYYNVSRSIGGGAWTILNPSEIHFDQNSGFAVSGEVPGDTSQPFVTIRLFGNIVSLKGDLTPFGLETSVSQRLIDISQ